MSINGKNIHDIEVVLDSNMNFTIRVYQIITWGLANNLHIYKTYEKLAEHIILSNSI